MAEDRPDSPPSRIPYRPPGIVFIDEGTDGADTGIIGRKRRADFRGRGVVVTDGGDRAIITIEPGAFFCYDYLVDTLYTGTEGAVISSPDTTHTFKIYSTVKGAVDDANANRQANGQSTSFLICGTGTFEARYQEATQIDLDPPSGGSYHLFGTGADTTQIEGTMASGSLFNIPTQSLDSLVEFHHIELSTLEAIALIQGGGSTRIALDNCGLRPNDSGARAIEAGSGAVGWNISNTNFEGAGIGIDSGTLMNVRLTNCYMAMTVGIRMVNATQVHCTNVKFNCSSRDVEIGATTGALVFSAGGGCEFNKGIYFTSGASLSWFDNFVVNGCIFILGSGETGIDYSGATREGALTEAAAHSITGNTFRGSGTAKGIVGGSALADGPHCATVVGNTFEGFTADNEIIDMDLTGDNIVAHNCTDSGATLYDSHDDEGVISKIIDTDRDTSWDTEESPDEDILRAKVAGTERVTIHNTGDILRLLGLASEAAGLKITALDVTGSPPPVSSEAYLQALWDGSTGKLRLRINLRTFDFTGGGPVNTQLLNFGTTDSIGFLDNSPSPTARHFEIIVNSETIMRHVNPSSGDSFIESVGWRPFTDAAVDFGTSSKRWKDGYFSGTIRSASAPTSIQVGGSIVTGADQAAADDVSLDLVATDRALLLNRLTTTQRDALTALDGMALYNTTTGKFQVYENGAWVDWRHAKYTDAEAVTAVESEDPLDLAGVVNFAKNMNTPHAGELTLDSDGIINVTGSYHTVDTFGDAPISSLNIIKGPGGATPADGQRLYLSPAHDDRAILIRHEGGGAGANSIRCVGQASILLDDVEDFAILIYSTSQSRWFAMSSGGLPAAERQVEIVIPLKKALPAATNNATLDDDYLYKKPYNVARRINKWYIRFESNLAAEAIFELRKNGTVLAGSSITIAAAARDAAIDSFTEVTLADGDSLEVWQVGGNAEDIGGRATVFGDEDIVAAVS